MPLFKYFKFLLVITLSIFLLTACGGGSSSTDGTTSSGTGSNTTTATKPTATTLTTSIPENTTAVGTLNTNDNGSTITSYEITGGDAALFSISATGVITAKNAFDFEAVPTKTSFSFQATATNAVGTSDAVTVTVTVTDVADNTPTVTAATFRLLESAKSETVVGKLTITQGDAAVNSAALTGTGAANFTITEDGTISVTSGTPSLGQDFTLTATISNQHGDSTATVTIDTFKASFAGTTGLTGTATPKLMPLGDSITSGQGGELTGLPATNITTNLNTALTNINTAFDSIRNNASIDFTNTLTDANSAKTALTDAETALDNYIALGSVPNGVDNFLDGNGNPLPRYQIEDLDEAITAIDDAITAIDLADNLVAPIDPNNSTFIEARNKTSNAKDEIRSANRNAYGAIQRLTYRKSLLEKKNLSTTVNFDVIGRNTGPRETNGTSFFADNNHEGYSSSFASLSRTGFLILNEQLNISLTGDANNAATPSPDIVLLHIGTNDIAFGGNGANDIANDIANAIDGAKEVIKTLRASNPEVVILLAKIIPLIESNLEYRGDAVVDTYNASLTTLFNDDKHPTSKLILVDHTTPFAAGASLYVGDGVHPNTTGDEIMATTWFTELESLFQVAP